MSGATNACDSTIGAANNTDPIGSTRGGDSNWDRGTYEYVVDGGNGTPEDGSGAGNGVAGDGGCLIRTVYQ